MEKIVNTVGSNKQHKSIKIAYILVLLKRKMKDVFAIEYFFRNIWFILFLCFLAFLHIVNSDWFDTLYRQLNYLKKKNETLIYQSKSIHAALMYSTLETEIEKKVIPLGLQRSNQQPYLINNINVH